ncbi:MAG: site-2 protease family protein, partial [Prochloraceae cyanobacterium]
MNGNIRVGNLFGIPFYVNPSWFFILGLVTLSYGEQLAQF